MIQITPSLAAAPLDRLAEVIAELETAGVSRIHFDLEDGSFVPVMTLGTKIIQDARPLTQLPFDVHLMMVNPEWILPQLIQAGANRISVHAEACPYPRRTLRMIAELGATAGLAFNPATPLPDLAYLHPYLSFVVVLSSEPEIPDSPFLPAVLNKVQQGVVMPGMQEVEWVVDGGIRPNNIHLLSYLPVDTLVVGRAVFENGQIQANIRRLLSALQVQAPVGC